MICVVIPAFNEGDALRGLLPRLPAAVGRLRVSVIVIDDGSNDDTAAVAEAHGCAVVTSPENRGKGASLRRGIAEASAVPWEALVFMDGDGQHDPADLAALAEPILAGRADVASATRYGASAGRDSTPWNRYLVRTLTTALLARLLDRRFSDPYCGLKAFSPAAVAALDLRGDRYQSELEILFDCVDNDLIVAEVPIARVYGPGMSKMGAHRGAFLGRCSVLGQYARTIARRSYRRSRHKRTGSRVAA